MEDLIWRPVCPVCQHPARVFHRAVRTAVHLRIAPGGSVRVMLDDVLPDTIGRGLHPGDLTCAFCEPNTSERRH